MGRLEGKEVIITAAGQGIGKATAIRIGRKIQVWEIDIKDENDNFVCKSRLTLAVIEKND